MNTYHEVCEYLVKKIAQHPEAAKVEKSVDERGTLLSIFLHPEDFPRVIGRQGGTINAIRRIVGVLAVAEGSRASVTLANDPRGNDSTI